MILVLLKVLMSLFVNAPTIFVDEYILYELGESIIQEGSLTLNGETYTGKYPPLYSAATSFTHLFMGSHGLIQILNALILTLSIIPIYFLARESLDEKKSLIITGIIGLLASLFNTSNYVMSENLFFPLFLFMVWQVYEGFKTHDKKYFIISGILLGLSFWARTATAIIVPTVVIVYLFRRTKIMNVVYHYLVSLLVVTPLLAKNVLDYGFTLKGLTGGYRGPGEYGTQLATNFLGFPDWMLMYAGYIILSTGIIFGIYYIAGLTIKNRNYRLLSIITGISTLLTIVIFSNQANTGIQLYPSPFFPIFSGRPIGRYMDAFVPLIILLGYVAWNKFDIEKKTLFKATVISSALLAFTTQFIQTPLFPFNNQNITLYGIFVTILERITTGTIAFGTQFNWAIFWVMFVLLMTTPFLFYAIKEKRKLVFSIFMIFIIMTTIASIGTTTYISKGWENSEAEQLGKWTSENIDKNAIIGINPEDCGALDKETINDFTCEENTKWSLFGLHAKQETRIGNQTDYLYSISEQEHEEVKRIGNAKLYKITS